MGGAKHFGPVPHEVLSMLKPGAQGRRSSWVTMDGMRKQARDIHETLTPARVDAFVNAAGFSNTKMRERVRKNLKARVEWMGRFGSGATGWPVQEELLEAAWLGPLEEAALPYEWKEALHPRDQHGKFVEKIGGLPGGKAIQLDAKTTIKRDKDGTFRVVRSGGIIKGFASPADAARAALDRSVKGKDADSVGGTQSFKDYNDYLKHRGFDPMQVDAFGGKKVSKADLQVRKEWLQAAIAIAEKSEDKYVQRQLPTLKSRLAEAEAKLAKAPSAGGPPDAGSPEAVAAETVAKKASVDLLGGEVVELTIGKTQTKPYTAKVLDNGMIQVTWPGTKNGSTVPYSHVKNELESGHWKVKGPARESVLLTAKNNIVKVGTTFTNSSGKTWTVTETDPVAKAITIKSSGAGGGGAYSTASWASARHAIEKGVWTDVQPAKPAKDAAKPEPVAKPAKVKAIKGSQSTADLQLPAGGMVRLKHLDLAAGDVVQEKKGGWKWTLEKEYVSGKWVATANGKKKFLSPYKPIGFVTKADGSAVQVAKEGAAAPAPAAAPKPVVTVESVAAKLSSPPSGVTIGQLKDGDVIGTPDGSVGVVKPGEQAYQGYVTAYNIKTGQKFEPPADKPPLKFSNDPAVKADAAQVLANAQAGTKVTTAGGASGTVGSSPAAPVLGPPPEFSGVASWHSAVPHIPTPQAIGLTKEEKSAITSYTGSGYGSINAALRDSGSVKDLHTAKQAAAIKRALTKAVVKEDVWIGRHTNAKEWKTGAVAGKSIGDNGVLSTSYDPNTWNGDIHLNILVPKGAHALNVESISNHPGEQEVLLPPGTLFGVLKREEKGGKVVLYVKVL